MSQIMGWQHCRRLWGGSIAELCILQYWDRQMIWECWSCQKLSFIDDGDWFKRKSKKDLYLLLQTGLEEAITNHKLVTGLQLYCKWLTQLSSNQSFELELEQRILSVTGEKGTNDELNTHILNILRLGDYFAVTQYHPCGQTHYGKFQKFEVFPIFKKIKNFCKMLSIFIQFWCFLFELIINIISSESLLETTKRVWGVKMWRKESDPL